MNIYEPYARRLMKKEKRRRTRLSRREIESHGGSSRDFRPREKVTQREILFHTCDNLLHTLGSDPMLPVSQTPGGEINIGATRLRSIARIRRRTSERAKTRKPGPPDEKSIPGRLFI